MLIFIPISRADAPLGAPLAQHIVNLGGVRRHDIVLFYCGEEAMNAAHAMQGILTGHCGTLVVVDSKNTDERGWPMSPNSMFKLSIQWVDKSGYAGPWYFFELDNTPLRPNWADALQDEYLKEQKPFMGVKQPNIFTSVDGIRETRNSFHMAGTGLYPAPFHPHSKLWRFLNTTAFDVFLMHEIVPHMHHTELIQHAWCSCNYRRKGKEIICSCTKGHEVDGLANPVRPDAAVLHGCKDLSLIKLFKKSTAAPPPSANA